MAKFYKISDDTISTFKAVFTKKSFPFNVGFEFIGCESQKNLIKISKLPDQFSFVLEKELLVQLARTSDLHSEGHRFDSGTVHKMLL